MSDLGTTAPPRLRPEAGEPGGRPAAHRRVDVHRYNTPLREWPHGPDSLSPEEATRDLAARLSPAGGRYWLALAALAALGVVGLVALASLAIEGPAEYGRWGYAAAAHAFVLSGLQAGPLLALITRVTRGLWGVPVRRLADALAVTGLVSAPLFTLLLLQVPFRPDRPSIWFDWPGAPLYWDTLAVWTLAILGLALIYVTNLPDLGIEAEGRHPRAGWPRVFGATWYGSPRQWRVARAGILLLGTLYFIQFCFVQMLLASDLTLSLVPGWKSALMGGPYQVLTGFHTAVAATTVGLAILRRTRRLEAHVGVDVFHNAGIILLVFALLFFYFTWAEVLTLWYGRTPSEIWVLALQMFGPYLWLYVAAFALHFVVPFALLLWNPIRMSVAGPTVAAGIVLVGSFVDRVRIYVAAWSVAGREVETPIVNIPALPPVVYPHLADLLAMLGILALALALYLLTLRIVRPLSLWEYKVDRLLRVERPYLDTEVPVVARPT